MAPGPAARFRRDAQIAGIYEAHVFRAFLQPLRVHALGIRRAIRQLWIARLRVRLPFHLFVFGRSWLRRPKRLRTSAFPPWQSVQPRRTVPVACMVG